jgi:hypothetical protein
MQRLDAPVQDRDYQQFRPVPSIFLRQLLRLLRLFYMSSGIVPSELSTLQTVCSQSATPGGAIVVAL